MNVPNNEKKDYLAPDGRRSSHEEITHTRDPRCGLAQLTPTYRTLLTYKEIQVCSESISNVRVHEACLRRPTFWKKSVTFLAAPAHQSTAVCMQRSKVAQLRLRGSIHAGCAVLSRWTNVPHRTNIARVTRWRQRN